MPDLFANFTRDGQRVLDNARRAARKHQQSVITAEHLLLGVLQLSGSQAEAALERCNLNPSSLITRLNAIIKLDAKQDQSELETGYVQGRLKLSLESKRLIDEAIAEAQENALDFIDARILILGMLRYSQGSVATFLAQYSLTLEQFRVAAQLHETSVADVPRSQRTVGADRPDRVLVSSLAKVSPIFIGLVMLLGASGYLLYANIGNNLRPAVFMFVICGWVISVVLHEFGHALVAYWGGDQSVVDQGYLTLDPVKYTHPFLSIVLPVIFLLLGGIGLPGGAVYINPGAIRDDLMRSLTAAAGPIVSAFCAFLAAFPFFFIFDDPLFIWAHLDFWASLALLTFLEITAVCLNLLPIPGLDGFGILEPFLSPEIAHRFNVFRPFTFFILYALLFLDTPIRDQFWAGVLNIVVWIHPELPSLVGHGLSSFQFWAS